MEVSAKTPTPVETEAPAISKNQLKKLKRDEAWEENRVQRKERRKEKAQEKKQRRRTAREEANAALPAPSDYNQGPGQLHNGETSKKRKRPQFDQLPITLVLDCGFDDLMMDKERKSLASQVTRSYSDTHRAPYQAHLAISSFSGSLKERFDGLLSGNYRSWKNVRFLEGDFVEAAAQAKGWMKSDSGGKLAGVFAEKKRDTQNPASDPDDGEVVYLTSDSPHTLTELKPYSTYIIGGIVDRNRHKGVCYKRAMDRGMKTAKLPIGDYMQMTSRFVLATNHVVEIMLRWLELGDWGKAFLQVVPKRKGGVLKDAAEAGDEEEGDKEEGDEEDVDDQANERVLEENGDAEVGPLEDSNTTKADAQRGTHDQTIHTNEGSGQAQNVDAEVEPLETSTTTMADAQGNVSHQAVHSDEALGQAPNADLEIKESAIDVDGEHSKDSVGNDSPGGGVPIQ